MLAEGIFARLLLALLAVASLGVLVAGQVQWQDEQQQRLRDAEAFEQRLSESLHPRDLDGLWWPQDLQSASGLRLQDTLARTLPEGVGAMLLRLQHKQAWLVSATGLLGVAEPGQVYAVAEPELDRAELRVAGRAGLWLRGSWPGYALVLVDDHPDVLGWWADYLQQHATTLAVLLSFALALGWQFLRRYGAPLAALFAGLRQLASGQPWRPARRRGGLAAPLQALDDLARQQGEYQRLRQAMNRYLSSAVVQQLSEDDSFASVGGEKRVVTVLFADMANFTQLTADLAPERVVGILNACLDGLAEVIQANHGTLDKFVGDGLMAIFGAPAEDAEHATHAVDAALAMQAAIGRLRQELALPELRLGIGINTGPAIVGNIGSESRLDYTAIGAAVNLAARLQSLTRSLAASIVVGSGTMQRLDDRFETRRIDGALVKGLRELLTVFIVEGRNHAVAPTPSSIAPN